jgi:hypothetical protein
MNSNNRITIAITDDSKDDTNNSNSRMNNKSNIITAFLMSTKADEFSNSFRTSKRIR